MSPSIYAKGGDYTLNSLDPAELAVLEEISARIEILPLVPGKSTSKLIEAIHEDEAPFAARSVRDLERGRISVRSSNRSSTAG